MDIEEAIRLKARIKKESGGNIRMRFHGWNNDQVALILYRGGQPIESLASLADWDKCKKAILGE